jgi:hypothetical protein
MPDPLGFPRFQQTRHQICMGNVMKIFTRGKTKMSRFQFARVLFVLLVIVGSTTMLQAQTPCNPPCPANPCNPPCQAPAPSTSTHGAWEAYLFAGGTTHSGNIFDRTFTVGNTVVDVDRARMPGSGTFGGKIGGFVTPNFSIDGSLSWYNHLLGLTNRSNVFVYRPITNTIAGIASGITTNDDVTSHSLLWEASFNYDFVGHTIGARWTPYVVAGAGGLTARIKNAEHVFVTGGGFIRNPNAGSPEFIPNPVPVRTLDNNDTFFTVSYGGGFKALRLAGPVGFRFDVRGRTLPNFFGQSATFAEFTGGLAFAWGER